MKNRSPKKRLAFITALLTSALLLLGLANFEAQRRLSSHLQQLIVNDVPTAQLLALINEVHDSIRGTAMDSMLASVTRDRARVRASREKFEDLRSDSQKHFDDLNGKQNSKEFQKRLEATETEFRSYLAAGDDLTGAADEGIRSLAAPLQAFETKFLQLEKSLLELGAFYAAENDGRVKPVLKLAGLASQISLLTLLVALVSGVAFAWLINKHILQAMERNVEGRVRRPQLRKRAA